MEASKSSTVIRKEDSFSNFVKEFTSTLERYEQLLEQENKCKEVEAVAAKSSKSTPLKKITKLKLRDVLPVDSSLAVANAKINLSLEEKKVALEVEKSKLAAVEHTIQGLKFRIEKEHTENQRLKEAIKGHVEHLQAFDTKITRFKKDFNLQVAMLKSHMINMEKEMSSIKERSTEITEQYHKVVAVNGRVSLLESKTKEKQKYITGLEEELKVRNRKLKEINSELSSTQRELKASQIANEKNALIGGGLWPLLSENLELCNGILEKMRKLVVATQEEVGCLPAPEVTNTSHGTTQEEVGCLPAPEVTNTSHGIVPSKEALLQKIQNVVMADDDMSLTRPSSEEKEDYIDERFSFSVA